MKEFNVTAVIWKEDDVYVSKCPELEVASAGDTPKGTLISIIKQSGYSRNEFIKLLD